ncbi:hypothetical protein ACLOJK_027950 [Asimina triloba]
MQIAWVRGPLDNYDTWQPHLTLSASSASYAERLEEAIGKKAGVLGPPSLVNKDALEKENRGKAASASASECLNWLDLKPPKSVVYISFGNMCRLTTSQLIEIGLGVEASNKKTRDPTKLRMGGGWIRREGEGEGSCHQRMGTADNDIVSPSYGFDTGRHLCRPTYDCPASFRRAVLEIAVGIDVRTSSRPWEETRNNGEVVKMEDVKEAVQKLMDGGRGAEERRKRAKELGEKAMEAMEVGGSSYTSITDSIQYVKTF